MKMKVVNKKLIKPQQPTPENLKKLNLSILDELAAPVNVGVVMLYRNDPTIKRSPDETRRRLQESLSETLTEFYPLAGRYMKDDHYVDCADQGVEWVDAEAETELIDKMTEADDDQLTDLLPRPMKQADPEESALASIQMTVFKCGGVAIGVSISHKIFDGPSMGTFLKAWSSSSLSLSSSIIIRPSFDWAASLFPRNPGLLAEIRQRLAAASGHVLSSTSAIVAKRFRFNKEAIANVRSRCDLAGVSRVRVVCAVITKALMGVERMRQSATRPTVAVQLVNMRGRMVPPAPEHCCGNMITMSVTAPCIIDNNNNNNNQTLSDDEHHIKQVAELLDEGLKETVSECASTEAASNPYRMVMAPLVKLGTTGEANLVFFTDLSKLGLYETDFGWGKPVGAGAGEMAHQNSVLLMESEEPDGLDAWVHLTPDHMALFQQDKDIHNLSL